MNLSNQKNQQLKSVTDLLLLGQLNHDPVNELTKIEKKIGQQVSGWTFILQK